MQLLNATIGDTFSISANFISSNDIYFDKVIFVCEGLGINKEMNKIENNLFYCEFSPNETINFKSGNYTATITRYVENAKTSKTYSLLVKYNPNLIKENTNEWL